MTGELALALGLCVAGLATMVAGAEMLVRGGSALAARLRISPVIVGLTIVAMGTSAPELAVGIDSALRGNGALAVGNIAGTNSVNILLVLGLSALMLPLDIQRRTIVMDLPAMLLAAGAFFALSLDGSLSRIDGAVLVGMGLVYSTLLIRFVLKERAAGNGEHSNPGGGWLLHAIMLVAGIAIVVVGADWLVNGGVKAAEIWGVSDAFIGLTVVAIGTSAPELVTAVVSTLRGERDIAIGNILGSSTYNIALILGITSLAPNDGVPVPEPVLWVDIPVMGAAVLACIPAFLIGKRVSRLEGGLFVAAYAIYLGYLLIARTQGY